MAKEHFYDPFTQDEQEQMQIRGFQTTIAGTYVLLDDVVTALREYAQSLDDPNAGGLVHELATWLQGGQVPIPSAEADPVGQDIPLAVFGAESDDQEGNPERIEFYPVDNGQGRIKWYARTVNANGQVLKVAKGSFDRSWVERNAEDRWPGLPMYEVTDEAERSVWKERGERGYKHGLFPAAAGR